MAVCQHLPVLCRSSAQALSGLNCREGPGVNALGLVSHMVFDTVISRWVVARTLCCLSESKAREPAPMVTPKTDYTHACICQTLF